MAAIGDGWATTAWIQAAWIQAAWEGGAAAATLSGLLSDGASEHELFSTPQDVRVNLVDETFVSGVTFNDARQALIDGMDSALSETGGWNAIVRDSLSVAAVTRISDTRVIIQMPAFDGFAIDSNETITFKIPASILTAASELTATPTFTITASTETGTPIVNADSTTNVATNYEQCDRSGFRVMPGELVRNWDGVYTRSKSYDPKHPQLLIRSVADKIKGSIRPEPDNNFLTEDVTADDL